MRILFEITHPKHAHLFRNAMKQSLERNHEIAITARKKDVTLNLLRSWRQEIGPATVLSEQGKKGMLRLGQELLLRNWRLIGFCREFRPDLIVARVGPSAAQCGRLLGIPVVVFEDTDDARLQQWISFPFATHVCTASHYARSWGRKHIRYNSFDELAYLHPNRFTPDLSIPRNAGLDPGNYIVVRCVSWQASHDISQHGINRTSMIDVVGALNKLLPVVITAETELPDQLKSFQLPVPPEEFHHILAGARLTFGESSTVATEGAMCGVPGILINTMRWSSVDRLVNDYGLLYQSDDTQKALDRAKQWLNDSEQRGVARDQHSRLVNENEDLTHWMVALFEKVHKLNRKKRS